MKNSEALSTSPYSSNLICSLVLALLTVSVQQKRGFIQGIMTTFNLLIVYRN